MRCVWLGPTVQNVPVRPDQRTLDSNSPRKTALPKGETSFQPASSLVPLRIRAATVVGALRTAPDCRLGGELASLGHGVDADRKITLRCKPAAARTFKLLFAPSPSCFNSLLLVIFFQTDSSANVD
jgi:hypothetical protein